MLHVKPGKPASATVGISAAVARRFGLFTARTRILPERRISSTAGGESSHVHLDLSASEAGLLADLGRPPTAVDRIAIETLSTAMVRARRLRATGKNDVEQTRLIAQLLKATGIKSAPATGPAIAK
jgi:hypothetical protein